MSASLVKVRAQRMSLPFVHTALKEGAEDWRSDLSPVLGRRVHHQQQFLLTQLDRIDDREQATVEILDILEASASGGPGRVHLIKQCAEQVITACPIRAVVQEFGEHPL